MFVLSGSTLLFWLYYYVNKIVKINDGATAAYLREYGDPIGYKYVKSIIS